MAAGSVKLGMKVVIVEGWVDGDSNGRVRILLVATAVHIMGGRVEVECNPFISILWYVDTWNISAHPLNDVRTRYSYAKP